MSGFTGMTMIPAARAGEVWQVYGSGKAAVHALRGVSAEFDKGIAYE